MVSAGQKPKTELLINPKILVIRYSSLGDVALTNPLLDRIEALWPSAEVCFATKKRFAPAVQHHPILDRVIALEGDGLTGLWSHIGEIRRWAPHLVLDLHDSLRSHLVSFFLKKARLLVYDKQTIQRRLLTKQIGQSPSLHTIEKYLKVLEPLGLPTPSRVSFEVHVSDKNQAFMKQFAESRNIPPSQSIIGLGPCARWFTKRWFPERYAELASRLVEDYRCRLFWFGSPDEAAFIRSIQEKMKGTVQERGLCMAGEYSLAENIALLGRCDLFIGNDSGWTHLASGRGCRVVVLFGSTTPSLGFEPWGPHSVVEASGLACRPCHVHGRKACPLGHFKCMENITVDLAEGAVRRSMRRNL
jgi:ADP-heptose:LPS heptosyltransferase